MKLSTRGPEALIHADSGVTEFICSTADSISTKRIAISVIGFWRPVNTFASLIGLASGRNVDATRTHLIRSVDALETREEEVLKYMFRLAQTVATLQSEA